MQLKLTLAAQSNSFEEFAVCELLTSKPNVRAKIDLSDLPKVLSVSTRWFAYWHPGVQTHYVATERGGKRIFLHRLITDAPEGTDVDHRFHDGLDNRRDSLRVVSHAENMQNQRRKVNKHGFTGVRERAGKFIAHAKTFGKWIHLGTFDTPEEAGAAYQRYFNERLNASSPAPEGLL